MFLECQPHIIRELHATSNRLGSPLPPVDQLMNRQMCICLLYLPAATRAVEGFLIRNQPLRHSSNEAKG